MSRKPAIPGYTSPDKTLTVVISALKENIELMNGSRPGTAPLKMLASTATTTDIINKINEIIDTLNYS